MDLRSNTIFGWVLGAGIVALGATSLTGLYFRGERPEEMGYMPAGVASSEEAEVPLETLLAQADVAAGEQSFSKCAACHTINAGGANGIGPNLHGVVGASIGGRAAGFSYSAALSGHGGNWDFASLNAWLTSPRRFADGTTMSFAGLSDAQERANLIVYLNSQGANLPLPAAPAAAAPAEGEAAAPADGEAAAAPAEGAAPAAAAPAAPNP
jgi:cytochrome c